jgi:hypothetical protein
MPPQPLICRVIKKDDAVSLSSLLFMAICTGMYKLGAFNERHPGQMRAWLWRAALWTWKSLNP